MNRKQNNQINQIEKQYPHTFHVVRAYQGRSLWSVHFALSDDEHRRAGELAAVFGLSVADFLAAVATRRLPGQPPDYRENDPERLVTGPEDFRFEGVCPRLNRRLERGAAADRKTVAQFVADALEGDLDALEGVAIFHPVTGDIISQTLEVDGWQVEERWIGQGTSPLPTKDDVHLCDRGRALAAGQRN